MTRPAPTHVLLDFFGTIVTYSPGPDAQPYRRSHEMVAAMGATVGYADFLQVWEWESAQLEERSAADYREHSMADIAERCLVRLLRRQPAAAEVTSFAQSYLADWNAGVCYPPFAGSTIRALAARYRLAVVSNTLDAKLVPGHLAAMGLDGYFDAVVTSIEVGWRKPHPAIYARALRRLGTDAGSVVFAGDTYDTDYAGPASVGLTAFLIDPQQRHDIPASRRLRSLADLPARLA
ncbi:MAG TPA: HAD family hydrolase [Streptosporangiaceae bacterium]|nr:HAD family hydrolase [Streptosporangiaceae bacterium]